MRYLLCEIWYFYFTVKSLPGKELPKSYVCITSAIDIGKLWDNLTSFRYFIYMEKKKICEPCNPVVLQLV